MRRLAVLPILLTIAVLAVLQGARPVCACSTRKMAYRASMMSDLWTIADAEAAFFARHGTYTTDTAALDFRPSTGVTVIFERADSTGWRARARHPTMPEGCVGGAGAGAPTETTASERPSGRFRCEPLDDPFGMRPLRIVTGAGVLSILIALALVRRVGARPGSRAPPVKTLALLAIFNPFWILLLGGPGTDCGLSATALSVMVTVVAWLVTAVYFLRRHSVVIG